MKALKRNPSVELTRLIACLIVIGVHCGLGSQINGHYDLSRTYIATFLADGTGIFWLIGGFFFFSSNNYGKKMKSTFTRIIIPMLLLSVFAYFFGDAITNGTPVSQGFDVSVQSLKSVLKSLSRWRNPVDECGHLWYLYVYILLAFVSPMLCTFSEYLSKSKKRERLFLLLSFLFLVWNDYAMNELGEFSHHMFGGAVPGAIIMLWGSIIYRHREFFAKRIFIPISLVSFAGLNLLRTYIQMARADAGIDNNAILYWYSSIGLLCSISLAVFGFSLIKSTKPNLLNRLICFLASYTFPVYLIHILVRNYYRRIGVMDYLSKLFLTTSGGQASIWQEFVYTGAVIVSVFAAALVISIVLRFIKKLLLFPFSKGKKKNAASEIKA